MKSIPGLTSFTFIPMLTATDAKTYPDSGTKKDLEKALKAGKAGSQNSNLLLHVSRLQEIDSDLEYARSLCHYFKNENILMDILHPHSFTHKEREKYFSRVFENFPKKALVFLDPDIGLEESKPDQRHLLFDEVKMIYDHLDAGSILLIYQHFPRKVHEDYIRQRCSQLSELTGSSPFTITDNEIIFFLCTKSPGMQDRLETVLESYANSYPALCSHSCR
ncbi:MAG: hypothetical protein Q7T80_01140 [Methanoregula sp.]|nr:hypothetical protein [Methanoregula sp.]